MLRTIFSIGLFAVLGLVILKVLFGIFGLAITLFLWLLSKALIIGAVLLVAYFVIRLVSPDTAARLRAKFSGSSY